jgi:hypothetical protein
VAFEPPVTELLPDRERWRAFIAELYDTYRSEGISAAGQKFGEGTGLAGGGEPDESEPRSEPDPEVMAAMARMGENIGFWFVHVLRPSFMGYAPDIAKLRAALGRSSADRPPPAGQLDQYRDVGQNPALTPPQRQVLDLLGIPQTAYISSLPGAEPGWNVREVSYNDEINRV